MTEVKISRTVKRTYLGAQANSTDYNYRRANWGVLLEWLDDAVGQPVEHPAGTFVASTHHGKGHRAVKTDELVTRDRAEAEAWLLAKFGA